jgi:hypothetical protein
MDFDIDELLTQGKVPSEEELLPADFRKRFNLGPIHQLGLAVPSVLETAHRLEDKLGIGPFFIAEDDLTIWIERGQDKYFHGKLGMASFQGYELELLEPGKGSTFYADYIRQDGRIALHHLGFIDHNLEAHVKELNQAGIETAVRAQVKVGTFTGDVAYMDARNDTGLYVELIDYRLFKIPIAIPASVMKTGARFLRLIGIHQIRMGQHD